MGGVITSANDVGRYPRALLDGGALGDARVLSPDSVNAISTPTFRTGDTTAVGLGLDAQGHRRTPGMDLDGGHWHRQLEVGL